MSPKDRKTSRARQSKNRTNPTNSKRKPKLYPHHSQMQTATTIKTASPAASSSWRRKKRKSANAANATDQEGAGGKCSSKLPALHQSSVDKVRNGFDCFTFGLASYCLDTNNKEQCRQNLHYFNEMNYQRK